jgi:hypothetical protein
MEKTFIKFVVAFVILLIVVMILASPYLRSSAEMRRQIKYEHEYIYAIWSSENAALRSDEGEAAKVLFELQEEPFKKFLSVRLDNSMESLVNRERERAIRTIIGDLRRRTGTDLGEDPKPWVLKFGDDTYKDLQRKLNESSH